jgi:hypothetical protein
MGTGAALPLSPQEMQTVRAEINNEFSSLQDAFQVTSWPLDTYNCIAWAAEDHCYWWWPDPDYESFWPRGVDREDTVVAFIAAFQTMGYELCDSYDLEPGFEKVAIYSAGERVKHMARQLPSGAWTSKLGDWWDIAHNSVDGVQDPPTRIHYGVKRKAMRRIMPHLAVIPSAT